MSIKPEYAFKIFDGKKKFEFRRKIFKNRDVKTVVVYASSPVQQVIGEFEIEDIYSLSPEQLWQKTKGNSGISEEYFFQYFAELDIAHAIKIKNIRRYQNPLCLREDFDLKPPQSYRYIG
jgi:predicted transcriptional regulator